ncbi:MAG: AMP-dependent synthetase/ligase [Gaiellaceae bacterium]
MALEAPSRSREGPGQRTINDLWERAASEARHPAFLTKEGGVWREVGWGEARERVDHLAAGFLALGLRKGDCVAILSRTRLEWTLCDYAVASIGAVVIPIYPTSSKHECSYLLSDSSARALVCEDEEQLGKVRDLAGELPALEHTIVFDAAEGARPLSEITELGRAHLDANPQALVDARGHVSESDTLTYIYTSGTTGNPKGCVLSHRNWHAVVDSIRRTEGLMVPGDVVLLFLPLAHNFARLVQFAGAGIGFTVAFCPDVVQVPRALTEVRPTVFPSVPRLFETVHGNVRSRFEGAEGAQRRIVDRALSVGRRVAARRERGKRVSPLLALQFRLADRLVYSKVKERLGGRLRLAISGGAPLSKEIIEFFAAVDVLILEGYGLTETTSGCALNRPDRYRFGTVGPALPGIEIELAADGEILVRGDTIFQGYHGKDEATAEVLTEDGWLLTGDIGTIEDGFVTITDRKKELIVTAGGKNVSPQNLENALKATGYVSQALVIGDNRPHIVALVCPDRVKVAKVAKTEDEVRELIAKAVEEVNSNLGPVEQIRRFAVLPREFSAEEGEVTPTLKLKRRVCEEHFRDEIEELYGSRKRA